MRQDGSLWQFRQRHRIKRPQARMR